MRALFFVNSFHGGGTEKVCLNLAKELCKWNIESDFITIYDKRADFDIPSYIHVLSLGLNEPILTRISIIKYLHKVNKFISDKNYVLITAHAHPSQYLASLAITRDRTLYVMHIPQQLKDKNNSWYHKFKLRQFLKKKKIITVSNGMKSELCYKYGIDKKNIVTIYNPCGVDNLKSKVKLESPHRKPYILFMGRLEEEKNPQIALELYYNGQFYNDYDLVYLGKGSLEQGLKRRVSEINLNTQVFFAGFHKNPEQWLLNAELLLSCSRQEGFALNIAEALVCRTPVVAVDCPYGPREILIDELSKYLIHPEREFDKSIATITSALESYPEITEKYYRRFDDAEILQTYLQTWNMYFGEGK